MISVMFKDFGQVLKDVAIALAPIIIAFAFFQIFLLKLPKKQIIKMIKGVVITFFGLAFFLQGVHIGFMPAGDLMGMILGALDYNWILIPLGLFLGFAVIMAEPAVRVLTTEVEKASGGHINKKYYAVYLVHRCCYFGSFIYG